MKLFGFMLEDAKGIWKKFQESERKLRNSQELIYALIQIILMLRYELRQKKEYELSDRVRNYLALKGIQAKDPGKGGQEVFRYTISLDKPKELTLLTDLEWMNRMGALDSLCCRDRHYDPVVWLKPKPNKEFEAYKKGLQGKE